MLQGLLNTVNHFTAKEQILAVYGTDFGKSAEWVIQYDSDESNFSFKQLHSLWRNVILHSPEGDITWETFDVIIQKSYWSSHAIWISKISKNDIIRHSKSRIYLKSHMDTGSQCYTGIDDIWNREAVLYVSIAWERFYVYEQQNIWFRKFWKNLSHKQNVLFYGRPCRIT